MTKEVERIRFDYIKSNFFRVVHVTGGVGGLTPDGIHLALYNERGAIPQQVVHEVHDGKLAEEIKDERVGREAIVREVECDLNMSVETAKRIRDWLSSHIQIVEAKNASRDPHGADTKKRRRVKKIRQVKNKSRRKQATAPKR